MLHVTELARQIPLKEKKIEKKKAKLCQLCQFNNWKVNPEKSFRNRAQQTKENAGNELNKVLRLFM